ncbi:MAG: hypothetical protein M1822_005758 [Bathelium mastoideum]|nr:MAG: hypothetical protein M1822_005758 [Bathelium mastoideum]
MAPKASWKFAKDKSDAKPGTAGPVAEAPTGDTFDYVEAQNDEIEALKAIYMDDYEEVEVKSAWSRTTDRAMRLRVKAASSSEMSLVLSIKLTATYPKTVPLVKIEESTGLRQATVKKIERLLQTRPKELVGEVMIHELTESVKDVLEEAFEKQQREGQLPSLEGERALQEAAAAEAAKREEAERLKEAQQERAEEDRVLKQMLDEEISRRQAKRKSLQPLISPGIAVDDANPISSLQSKDIITFDQAFALEVEGSSTQFRAVEALTRLRDAGPVTEVFNVHPVGSQTPLVLKQTCIKTTSVVYAKKTILHLETILDNLRTLRHENCLSIYGSLIGQPSCDDEWQIRIVTEYADRGSLEDLLADSPVQLNKARLWTIGLLEGLDFYHRHGVVHGDIHANNVLLCRPKYGGPSTVKLSDAGYQGLLHDLKFQSQTRSTTATSAFWLPPEVARDSNGERTRKTDVWQLGIVLLQMISGIDVIQSYSSPTAVMEGLEYGESLNDIVRKFFKADPKRRPSAFDLLPSEFLRTDTRISQPISPGHSRTGSFLTPIRSRQRFQNSSSGLSESYSRYAREWVEMGRLGRGGYGEVLKARNNLDGRVYAIKKIKQESPAALTDVLHEVMLLSRLNHPYVVRYYAAWPEDELPDISELGEETASSVETPSFNVNEALNSVDFGHTATSGLDFVSSGGHPLIEFEDDDDSNSDAVESSDENESPENDTGDAQTKSSSGGQSLGLKRTMSSSISRTIRQILYIQMEYCERHTLRDLIRKDLCDNPENGWRLLRQIVEGLAHVHGHGIIHRDLKPENIFIDEGQNPKIGDFGLATSGQYHAADRTTSSADGDMTRSIGTAFYVAPELRSEAGGSYNEKVDMYSLGIIFFEMCVPLRTGMERDAVVRKLREKDHILPDILNTPDKALQKEVILSLVNHRPGDRPSSAELLRSGKLPLRIEDETIREALRSLSDSTSPYYQKMMSALFSQPPDSLIKGFAWDLEAAKKTRLLEADDALLEGSVRDRLTAIFRRHGALETQRPFLFPLSAYYPNSNVVQVLHPSGSLMQLPFDLTLPYARSLAHQAAAAEKTFAFGTVYRDTYTGGPPRSNREVDFDIVTYDTLDLALKEAEVLKVLDEVVDGFAPLAISQMCFHLNHANLLQLIMSFCRIPAPQQQTTMETLSKLNIQQWTWMKIRAELRAPTVGIPSTSLDDLARFDFRDTPQKAFARIRSLFEGTDLLEKTVPIFAHINTVIDYMKRLGVGRKTYIAPLSSFNDRFYKGGLMFQCVFDKKTRDVLAAGGRYDSLIAEHRSKLQGYGSNCHAVGMNLGWDRLITSMARYQKNAGKPGFLKKPSEPERREEPSSRRCDVLVASFDSSVLRSAGVKLVADLWAHDISAELAVDARAPEQLLAHYRDDKHSWIIIIKHDASTTGKPDLKVKSMIRKEDSDIRSSELISYLRSEFREREYREGTPSSSRARHALLARHSSHPESIPSNDQKAAKNVQVLAQLHRSKKVNKWHVIEAAQQRAAQLIQSYQDSAILAVETRDEYMQLLRGTRLTDPDSWRRAIQAVPVGDRAYLQQLHDLLAQYATRWRDAVARGEEGEGQRKVFVFNFRSGGIVDYDLGV